MEFQKGGYLAALFLSGREEFCGVDRVAWRQRRQRAERDPRDRSLKLAAFVTFACPLDMLTRLRAPLLTSYQTL
jgi:hypothetical protein